MLIITINLKKILIKVKSTSLISYRLKFPDFCNLNESRSENRNFFLTKCRAQISYQWNQYFMKLFNPQQEIEI